MNRAWSLLLAGALAVPCVAGSQAAGTAAPATWGIMAGRVSGTGAFPFTPGLSLGALARFPLAPRRLAVRADVMVHFLGDAHSVCTESGCAEQGLNYPYIVSGSLSLVVRMNDPAALWSPYLLAGPAVYLLDNTYDYLRPNHLGVQGGVGFEVRSSTHAFFAELRYMGVPPGGALPLTIGVRF